MALCGVRCGRLRCLFKRLVNCVHKVCVFLQIWNKWIAVSSLDLQKRTFWRAYFVKFKFLIASTKSKNKTKVIEQAFCMWQRKKYVLLSKSKLNVICTNSFPVKLSLYKETKAKKTKNNARYQSN